MISGYFSGTYGLVRQISGPLEKANIPRFGLVHTKKASLKAFRMTGFRDLENDGLEIPLALDQTDSRRAKGIQGFEIIGIATPEQ